MKKLTIYTLTLMAAVSCTKKTPVAQKKLAVEAPNFVSSELIVQSSKIEELKNKNPGIEVDALVPQANLYLVHSTGLKGKEENIAKKWTDQGLVNFAELNHIRNYSKTQDRLFNDLWGIKNVGQEAPNGIEGIEGADIKAEEAWAFTKSTGNKDVIVAVIDTGIDYTHPDLSANIYTNSKENTDENRANGKDDDGNGYADDVYGWDFVSYARTKKYHGQLGDPDPMDDNGHGTHCSGTIGAVGNNIEGVVGINQHVRLMALKVLDQEGSGRDDSILRAVAYAADNNADVINASFGGGGKSQGFIAALKYAEEKGVLFVAAAGNDGEDIDENDQAFPANYDVASLLTVAATDNRDQLAYFSNFGLKNVDIAAPGVNIMSTYPVVLAKGEGPETPYRVFSGTSMATPHVVGAAAFLIGSDPNLRKKPAEVKRRLMETVDWKINLAGKVVSGGRLNLLNAVQNKITHPLAEKQWVEMAYDIKTTSKPEELVNEIRPVHVDGAKALQIHFASAQIDSVDLAALYDPRFQLISTIPSDVRDYWSPIIAGDTALVRFANALVETERVARKEYVKDPYSVSEDAQCVALDNGNYQCNIMEKSQAPFANFDSEGLVVDKIRYIQ